MPPALFDRNRQIFAIKAQHRVIFRYLIIIVAGTVLYINGLGGDFVWDDRSLILQNQVVQNPKNILDPFKWSLTIFSQDCGYYRPLAILSFILDHILWRNDPLGFHLTNLLLHVGVLVCLALLFGQLLNRQAGLLAVGLFASLSVHVENVSFISGRMDILATLFILLAMLIYFSKNTKDQLSVWLMLICSLLTLAALLSKELSMVSPFLFCSLVLHKYPRHEWKSHILRIAFFFLCALAAYIAIRLTLLGSLFTLKSPVMPFGERLLMMPKTILLYLQLLILPYNLNARHTIYLNSGNLFISSAWPMIALILLVALIFILARKNKTVLLGSFWFLFSILPVLNIIPLAGLTVAERFLYLPSIGFATALTGFLSMKKILPLSEQVQRKMTLVILLLITGINALFTLLRNPVWHNEKAFFSTMIAQSPMSALAHHNLGYALYRDGKLSQAEAEYKIAIALNPSFAESHATLGDIFYKTGRFQAAITAYRTYLRIAPNAPNRQQTLERIRTLESLPSRDSVIF